MLCFIRKESLRTLAVNNWREGWRLGGGPIKTTAFLDFPPSRIILDLYSLRPLSLTSSLGSTKAFAEEAVVKPETIMG